MTTKPQKLTLPRRQAAPYAGQIVDALRPHVSMIEVAGSLRRGALRVGDVEIVASLRTGGDLFGGGLFGDAPDAGAVEAALARLIGDGLLAWDTEVKRNGPRYKRLVIVPLGGFPLDLFLCERDNFGNTLTIRTGAADFSRALVTARRWGGLRPEGVCQRDGYLWDAQGRKVPCKTEEAFFDALGLPFVAPQERDWKAVARLRREFATTGKELTYG